MEKQYPAPDLGDLYADKDWRSEGRVVRVVNVNHRIEHARIKVEAHPFLKVGRETWVSWKTLATKYKKVSR